MSLRNYLEGKYLISREAEYSLEEIANEVINLFNVSNENYVDVTGFAKDFYLSSSLTDEQKDLFYDILKTAGFFQQINTNLYSKVFSVCSWSIYVLGKFSSGENAIFLETAYETYFYKNPMLSYRCLSELEWLNSEKIEQYLSVLKDDQSIISKLTLLFYWEMRDYSPEFKELLTDVELVEFIGGGQTLDNTAHETSMRLFHFENHISNLYNSVALDEIDSNKFQSVVKDYFKAYQIDGATNDDKDHQEFLKNIGNTATDLF